MNRKLLPFFLTLLSLFGCSHVFYQPTTVEYITPQKLSIAYEELKFPSKDGTPLNGWFIPARGEKPRGTIVQFHGNAQNISSHFLSLVWLVHQGYNVFTFDYRGYGKSPGVPAQNLVHEDAIAGLNKAHELWQVKGQGLFVVYGQSLGSIISLRALEDWDQSKVDLIVQDSAFPSYKKIAFESLAKHWLTLILAPLGFLLVSDEYASWPRIHEITAPLLVITSRKDTLTPPHYGKWIYNHVGSQKKWIWKSHEAAHIGIYFVEKGKWREEFTNLLSKLSTEKIYPGPKN